MLALGGRAARVVPELAELPGDERHELDLRAGESVPVSKRGRRTSGELTLVPGVLSPQSARSNTKFEFGHDILIPFSVCSTLHVTGYGLATTGALFLTPPSTVRYSAWPAFAGRTQRMTYPCPLGMNSHCWFGPPCIG